MHGSMSAIFGKDTERGQGTIPFSSHKPNPFKDVGGYPERCREIEGRREKRKGRKGG